MLQNLNKNLLFPILIEDKSILIKDSLIMIKEIIKDQIMVQDMAFRILDKMIMIEEMDKDLKKILMIDDMIIKDMETMKVQDIMMVKDKMMVQDTMMAIDLMMVQDKMMVIDFMMVQGIIMGDSLMIIKNQTTMVEIRGLMINKDNFKEILDRMIMKIFIIIKEIMVIQETLIMIELKIIVDLIIMIEMIINNNQKMMIIEDIKDHMIKITDFKRIIFNNKEMNNQILMIEEVRMKDNMNNHIL